MKIEVVLICFVVGLACLVTAFYGFRRILRNLLPGPRKSSVSRDESVRQIRRGIVEFVLSFAIILSGLIIVVNFAFYGPSFMVSRAAVVEFYHEKDPLWKMTAISITAPLGGDPSNRYEIRVRSNRGSHLLRLTFDPKTKAVVSIEELPKPL